MTLKVLKRFSTRNHVLIYYNLSCMRVGVHVWCTVAPRKGVNF